MPSQAGAPSQARSKGGTAKPGGELLTECNPATFALHYLLMVDVRPAGDPRTGTSSPWRLALERFAVRRLVQLPPWLQTKLSGRPPLHIDGLTLHPELQLLLAAWKRRGGGRLRADSVEAARRALRAEMIRHPIRCTVGSVRDLAIPTAAGTLGARLYAPPVADRSAPLLLFFHGGGFVTGDLDTHDAACRLLCRHGELPVLAVDYRLAPEHPFPAAVEDAVAAFDWARRHAEELGADGVCVGGDSAGGNLAAVVARQTHARGGAEPAAQLLVYPVLDFVRHWPSRDLFATGFVLERADRAWFTSHYLRGGVDRSDPRVSPLAASDLSGLCPAYVVTAGFDPLRDEGEAYARALTAAGVPTTLQRHDGFVHGFVNMVAVSPASHAVTQHIAGAFGAMARRATPRRSAC